VGVEPRVPFLDFKFVELVMGLRKTCPDHALGQKAWLRSTLKGILPDEVLLRPKRGFRPPVQEWLSGVVGRYGGMLRDGVLMGSGVVSSAKAEAVAGGKCVRNWPELFFAYKLVLAEYWARSVMRKQP
jgi:asparagine synthase (glutamine-hydrolysing)